MSVSRNEGGNNREIKELFTCKWSVKLKLSEGIRMKLENNQEKDSTIN